MLVLHSQKVLDHLTRENVDGVFFLFFRVWGDRERQLQSERGEQRLDKELG